MRERMSDSDFEAREDYCMGDPMYGEAKRSREAEKQLEKINGQLAADSNFAMDRAAKLAIENIELKDALTMIAAKALDLMGGRDD